MEETKDKSIKPNDYTKKNQSPVTASIETPIEKVEVPVEIARPVAPPKPVAKPVIVGYKLNLYKGNGQLRSEISKGVYYEMSKRHGDIIRAISSGKFQTLDEICDSVWAAERRNFNRGHDRTRRQIEDAVADLVESTILSTRTS